MEEKYFKIENGKQISLSDLLVVGAKIKLGKRYCREHRIPKDEGKIIELIKGYFDEYNGLYCYTSECPAIKDGDDYDSIYHLFGNDFEYFYDCEILDN